ncbi:phosphopantetheinyl transferase-like protein [Streptosporangiaceae bacterium NEAU-GS5]|nr:phosphopantetheinyl transferase-like protein [Streptosporangiaceae bacterium NEAU-GS5]
MHGALVLAGHTGEILDIAGGALTPEERSRAERFTRRQDRLDFVAAHLLVRQCAADVLAIPVAMLTLVQRCERCEQPHGRPSIAEAPELVVTLSHTSGYVCAAASYGKVGVDAEHVTTGPADASLVALALTPAEAALVGTDNHKLIRQWVRKEALVKRGELALDRLREADLSKLPFDAPTSQWEGRHFLEWSAGTVLATAITDEPARLRLLGSREWGQGRPA